MKILKIKIVETVEKDYLWLYVDLPDLLNNPIELWVASGTGLDYVQEYFPEIKTEYYPDYLTRFNKEYNKAL